MKNILFFYSFHSTMAFERALGGVKDDIHSYKNPVAQAMNAGRFQSMWYEDDLEKTAPAAVTGKPKLLQPLLANYNVPSSLSLPEEVIVHSSIRYNGTFFAPGLAVISSQPVKGWFDDKKFPTFEQIILVYSIEEKLYLLLRRLNIEELSRRYVCLKSTVSSDFSVKEIDSLPVVKTFSVHRLAFKYFIIVDCLPLK